MFISCTVLKRLFKSLNRLTKLKIIWEREALSSSAFGSTMPVRGGKQKESCLHTQTGPKMPGKAHPQTHQYKPHFDLSTDIYFISSSPRTKTEPGINTGNGK